VRVSERKRELARGSESKREEERVSERKQEEAEGSDNSNPQLKCLFRCGRFLFANATTIYFVVLLIQRPHVPTVTHSASLMRRRPSPPFLTTTIALSYHF
jgi:hypothetical protein